MPKLTTEQLVVLAFFDAHDAAAMRSRGRWVWATQILHSPDLAAQFLKDWRDDQRNEELLQAWIAPAQGSLH
jgi:hypothetical protein